MAVEALKLREESAFRKEAIYNSHTVARVESGNERVSRGPNGLHVTRCNVAGGADKRETPLLCIATRHERIPRLNLCPPRDALSERCLLPSRDS